MHGLLDPDGPQAPTGGVAWIVMALPHHAAAPPSSCMAQLLLPLGGQVDVAAGPVQVNAESWGFPRVPPPDELCRRAAHAQRLRHALEDGGTRPSSTQAWPAGDIMQGGSAHHGIDGSAPPPSLSSGQAADGAAASDRAAEAVHGTAGAAGQREVQPCPPGVGDAREGQQQHAQPDRRHPGPLLHTAFLDALDSSRAFRSPHCEGEQAKALGAQARTAPTALLCPASTLLGSHSPFHSLSF